jgi:hypothetical protein
MHSNRDHDPADNGIEAKKIVSKQTKTTPGTHTSRHGGLTSSTSDSHSCVSPRRAGLSSVGVCSRSLCSASAARSVRRTSSRRFDSILIGSFVWSAAQCHTVCAVRACVSIALETAVARVSGDDRGARRFHSHRAFIGARRRSSLNAIASIGACTIASHRVASTEETTGYSRSARLDSHGHVPLYPTSLVRRVSTPIAILGRSAARCTMHARHSHRASIGVCADVHIDMHSLSLRLPRSSRHSRR